MGENVPHGYMIKLDSNQADACIGHRWRDDPLQQLQPQNSAHQRSSNITLTFVVYAHIHFDLFHLSLSSVNLKVDIKLNTLLGSIFFCRPKH